MMSQDMGASPLATGLGGAEAPEPPSRLGPADAIPSALTLTYEQIRSIYYAGTRRGEDEATSFEWGSRPSGKWYDELTDALHDIFNADLKWGEPGYRDWDTIEAWVKEGEQAHASAIEAQRAETVQQGSVHESAVAESETP